MIKAASVPTNPIRNRNPKVSVSKKCPKTEIVSGAPENIVESPYATGTLHNAPIRNSGGREMLPRENRAKTYDTNAAMLPSASMTTFVEKIGNKVFGNTTTIARMNNPKNIHNADLSYDQSHSENENFENIYLLIYYLMIAH